jgi:hypothetical protein
MTKSSLFRLVCSAFLLPWPARAAAEALAGVALFYEPGFPAVDTAAPGERLGGLLPGVVRAGDAALPAVLARRSTHLLVLPYGSAFPESAWPAIQAFLARGGNLLVVGGKPFSRAAYRQGGSWHLRPDSVRFMRELGIDQYQETPGSAGLDRQTNPDLPPALSPFDWRRAFSPLIRLSFNSLDGRDGAAGTIDARLDPLLWGSRDGHRLAAPVLQVDHLEGRFAGGRWILVSAELGDPFWQGDQLAALAARALRGSEEWQVRPRMPLYQAGETVQLDLSWRGVRRQPLTAEVAVSSSDGVFFRRTVSIPATRPLSFPAPASKGLHTVEARLLVAGEPRAVHRSGFWMRDREYLRGGPRLTVDGEGFLLDGAPLAVAGTTHMASDVQRLFFERPNVAVWDRDLAQIAAAGLNMVRTGWWSGWSRLVDDAAHARELGLRALEAYLMTARRHGLPVQFTFFAFLPEVLGGANAYLDPVALGRQEALIRSVVTPFHDVPFLAWDLINEPSFSRQLWSDRPNGDRFEAARWNEWLARRYPDRQALARAWNLPAPPPARVPIPTETELSPRSVYAGGGAQRFFDLQLFAQETFKGWVERMVGVIRTAGSRQLVTVGQDEGGALGRLSPAYFADAVDFTTNHSWWQNDALLWDSLVARQPGRPMLIQETGVQRELAPDALARRDPRGEAALVERKLALSLVQGSGALQWLWHTNGYMTQGNEACIGALRVDGTEKPEAAVMSAFARFARQLGPHLRGAQPPAVAVVTSQAAHLSVLRDQQVAAQQRAVRALAYDTHQPVTLIAEHRLAGATGARLLVLPAAQALTTAGWNTLLAQVAAGAALLVTGAVERDEHWQVVPRAGALVPGAAREPLTFRSAELTLGAARIPVSFGQPQQATLEWVHFPDGSSLREVAWGRGRIFWAALPVELAESGEPAARLYAHVLGRLGLTGPTLARAVPPGVLVYPTVLADAVLYVMVSERADDAAVEVVDQLTGARLALTLPAQRAAMAVIRRPDGALMAKYGF